MQIPALSPDEPDHLEAFWTNVSQAAARRTRPLGEPDNLQEAEERQRESPTAALTRLSLTATELAPFPFEVIDTAIAYLESALGTHGLPMPAASMAMLHVGIPHCHTHPPAMPNPLPSLGPVALGGCLSVLLSGVPAARVSDLGFAISCGCFSPIFQIDTGSSSVFIGNRRAARVLDLTVHCVVQPPLQTNVSIAFNINSTVGTLLKVERSETRAGYAAEDAENATDPALAQSLAAEQAGHQLNATIQSRQAVADAIALALRELVGRDPATTKCGGVLLTGNPWILIGGFPLKSTQSWITKQIATGLAKPLTSILRGGAGFKHASSWLSRVMHPGRVHNALARTLRILTGHPVDVVSGSFVLDALDVELPGALPLRLARSYSSTWGSRPSPFGHGWSHSLDESVWREADQLVYRAHDGRELELPLVDHETFIPQHRLTLRPIYQGWQIESPDGLLRDFNPQSQLLKIHDRRGHRIDLEYEGTRLVRAHTPDGRELRLHYTDTGHIARIDLPDPDPTSDALVPHIHYAYAGDDLIKITDALGHVTHYRHDNHKIVEETLPNGLRFHFDYDGRDTDAACTRTHGDGGIIDHSLIYDRPRRTTLVSNSHKEPTVIRYGAHGEPLTITDARGAVTRHEYDEHLRRTATIDPLGHATRHTYDARGNCTRTTTADGAATTVEYERDLPIAATDPAGGRWRWSYDSQSRLTRRTDPLGRTTTYNYSNNLTTISHPDGRRELHTHDLAGRLVRVDYPDGRTLHHTYDRRGRLVRVDLPDGTSETHAHDLLNRPVRHTFKNGDTRHFTHDDLGNLVRTCDARTDLRCTYTGLRWLASVGDVNKSPYTLERDLEGRVLRVADATGTLLQVERDATGRPRTCTDHRGRRRFTRDLAGNIITSTLDGQTSTITRDPVGRITSIDNTTRDDFTYRPDGALLTATRRDAHGLTTIRRELDIYARILREWQDDRWVALAHDLHDRITHLRSSSGADIRFHHDAHGLARVTLPTSTWTVTHERDRHGRELTRQLPGGITGWWHHDPAGRPLEHGITGSRPPQIHRHRRYTWTVDGRLTGELDLTARPRARTIIPPSTCPKDHTDHTPRRDALGRSITNGTTSWQWCGDLLVHTHAATTHTWIFDPTPTPAHPNTQPLARLSTHGNLSFLTDPTGTLNTFDDHGAPVTPPLDLPPTPPRLDLFGRPHEPTPALTLLEAELTDLPALELPTHAPTPREAAVLAAVFRTPPTP